MRSLSFCLSILLLGAAIESRAADAGSGLPAVGDAVYGGKLYRMNCAVCHGIDGDGKGSAASTLKTPPADLSNGSVMNARDDRMIYRAVQLGCKGLGCAGAMPAFGEQFDLLSVWDLVAYLRTLHLPLTAFFEGVDQYLVKLYVVGELGTKEFKEGQLERLKKTLGQLDPGELRQTVFTLFRAVRRRVSPELVAQDPRDLALLRKENKIGYVLFMDLTGPKGMKVPVGLALDTQYSIVRLVTTVKDPGMAAEYNRRFEKYKGLGKRGDPPDFAISQDAVGKAFDTAVTRVYLLAVEAANDYEFEERERSWADGTF